MTVAEYCRVISRVMTRAAAMPAAMLAMITHFQRRTILMYWAMIEDLPGAATGYQVPSAGAAAASATRPPFRVERSFMS